MYSRDLRLSAMGLAAALLLGACATSDKVTNPLPQPQIGTPCAGGTAVQLAPLQAVRVDCAVGTTVTLTAAGNYLVVPNLAVGGTPMRPVSYVISATGGSATASVVPLANAAPLASAASLAQAPGAVLQAWAAGARPSGPGALQRAFDGALRAQTRRNLASGKWSASALQGLRASVRTQGVGASVSATVPALGSLREFHVVSSLDTIRVTTKRVTASLQYIGSNILIYVDTASPPGGFTQTQMNTFGQTFDQVLYPIDLNAFGQPSDIDQNGHLIMLLTPVVNALTSRSLCSTQGYVAGFFDGIDLVSRDTTSNQGEVFYALAPDPNGTVSCAHATQQLEDELGATFLHEVQHLINFSQHVIVRSGNEEEGWLDEGLSLVAEELGSRYYEAKYPPPSGRTNPSQIFPDSAEAYIGGDLETSYSYLLETDTTTLTLHSDADQGLNWRGGDWLLLRWLGDQKGDAFYKALVQSPISGIANIEAAAGESFPGLFGDFSLALYTDSLPGVPRAAVPPRDRFVSRNLRQLYAAYYRVAGGTSGVPVPFPIQPTALTATPLPATIMPGTMAFYTATSTGQLVLTFAAQGGVALPAGLHPQLSIFRLP